MNDLRELKGYAVYINKSSSFIGTQNIDPVVDECVELDLTPPIITLSGPSTINLNAGENYIELGATAMDNIDGDVAVTINGNIDTSVSGTQYVLYNAVDAAGNHAIQATRMVIIHTTPDFLSSSDSTLTPIDQNVIGPVSQVVLGYLKITAQNEDQDLRRLLLSSTATVAADLRTVASSVALYDGNTQVTNFNAPLAAGGTCITAADEAAGDVCFAATDVLTPTTFSLNTPKTLKVVANLLTPAAEDITEYLFIRPGKLELLGKTSGVVASNGALIDLRTTTSLGTGGTYTVRSNVVEVVKDATSPSGSVRGTFVNHGIWQFTANGTAATLDIGRLIFTSRVGLPNVAGNAATAAMFRLYNVTTGAVITPVTITVNNAAGTVTFDGIPSGQLQLTRGIAQKVALQVTTTSTAVWPINTQLQWSLTTRDSIDVTSGGAGYGATTWSFPADANTVTLP
ncbi:MAG: DUF5011 domain-containing protein [Patescibacteria group bacterium]|nr:DUF5011 domain-containing protein [Patescibacteria group bacterium]